MVERGGGLYVQPMLVSIGRRSRPAGVAGLLAECHERIRSFSHLATRLGQRDDLALERVREDSLRCARYFTEALPLHVADEEESLLPRLRGLSPELDAALSAMHREHLEHESGLAALVAALGALGLRPGDAAAKRALREIATEVEGALELHLQAEERHIFPLVSRLTAADQDAIMAELRARR